MKLRVRYISRTLFSTNCCFELFTFLLYNSNCFLEMYGRERRRERESERDALLFVQRIYGLLLFMVTLDVKFEFQVSLD